MSAPPSNRRGSRWRWYSLQLRRMFVLLALTSGAGGCGEEVPPECDGARLPFRSMLSCREQFEGLAARPLDSSLPAAYTVKTLVQPGVLRGSNSLGARNSQDNIGDGVFFTDTQRYPLHRAFAEEQLGYPRSAPF